MRYLRVETKCKLDGFEDVIELLKKLPTETLKRAAIDRALLAATPPLIEAAKARVSVRTGALRESIRAGRSKRRTTKTFREMKVGPGWGFKGAAHGHLVEYGTGPRFDPKRPGRTFGAMPARPFMRPAFDATKHAMFAIIRYRLGVEATNSLRRLVRRRGW